MYLAADLIIVFDRCFLSEFNTRLIGGGDEPIYLPSLDNAPHQIVFTRDYFASALHEVAHWCVAGEKRRGQVDYGYWYAPDGRTAAQQAEFEQMEVKPQALEWLFSTACGVPFRVSADNLQAGLGASLDFKRKIAAQAQAYCRNLPERPRRFVGALAEFYGVPDALDAGHYGAEQLR